MCQADLGGKRRWTTEQRKTEKEMDRRRQAQHGGPAGCSSTWRMPRIELNGEGEPVWLTPHLRDPQPEGERERERERELVHRRGRIVYYLVEFKTMNRHKQLFVHKPD